MRNAIQPDRIQFFPSVVRDIASLFDGSNAGYLQSTRNCHTANTVAGRFDSNAEVRLRVDKTPTP